MIETIKIIASLITAITVIIVAIKNIFNKSIQPITKKIDELDKNQCKSFLVEFLCDVENGIKKSDEQKTLAYEIYDRYTKELQCNSYIHDKWEKLIK